MIDLVCKVLNVVVGGIGNHVGIGRVGVTIGIDFQQYGSERRQAKEFDWFG